MYGLIKLLYCRERLEECKTSCERKKTRYIFHFFSRVIYLKYNKHVICTTKLDKYQICK